MISVAMDSQMEKTPLEKAPQENISLKAKHDELWHMLAESEAALASLQRKYHEATQVLDEWEASAGVVLLQNELLVTEVRRLRNEFLLAKGLQPAAPTPASGMNAPEKESSFFASWGKRAEKKRK